jgi:hypothetical protein
VGALPVVFVTGAPDVVFCVLCGRVCVAGTQPGDSLHSALHEEVIQPAPEWALEESLDGGLAACSPTLRKGLWVVGDYVSVRVISAVEPSGTVAVPAGAEINFSLGPESAVSGVWTAVSPDVVAVPDRFVHPSRRPNLAHVYLLSPLCNRTLLYCTVMCCAALCSAVCSAAWVAL